MPCSMARSWIESMWVSMSASARFFIRSGRSLAGSAYGVSGGMLADR